MTASNALRVLRNDLGLTQTKLGDIMGLSQTYISQLESGAQTNISDDAIEKLMEYCGGMDFTPYAVQIRALMDAVYDARSSDRTSNVRPVPVAPVNDLSIPWYTTTVKAGNGAPIFGESVDHFDVVKHYAGTAVYEVSGDSMIDAGIEEGDRVLVKLGALFKSGDIVLCRYNGELMVKGATLGDGSIWLHPASTGYHSWAVKEGDQFECIGTVIEIFRKPRRIRWSKS